MRLRWFWSKPKQVGSNINTDGDEYYPSVTNDGTIYFTANYDNKTVKEEKITTLKKAGQVVTLDLGTLTLSKGIHDLKLIPVEIKKGELMKLLEIQLSPVK